MPVILGLFTGVTALIASEFIPVSLLTPISEGRGITPGTAGQTVTAVGAAPPSLHLPHRALERPHCVDGLGRGALSRPRAPRLLRGRLLVALRLGRAAPRSPEGAPQGVLHRLFRRFGRNSCGAPRGIGHERSLRLALGLLGSGPLSALTFVRQLLTMPAVKPNQSAGFSAMKAPLRDRRVVFGLFATFASYAGYHTVFTYVRPVLEESAGRSPSGVSIALLVYALVNVAGTLIAGKLYERNFAPAFIGTSVLALAAPILMWARSGHAAVIGALILSALVFGFIPVGWSVWMVRTVPGHTEVVGGLYVAVVQGSVWLAANAGGVLYDASGVEPLFLMSAAIALFGLILVPGALFGRIGSFSADRAASHSIEGAR